MTPDQIHSLKSWSEERDTMLAELSLLRSEKELISNDCNMLGENKAALMTDISRLKGSIEIMEEYEEERANTMSHDLVALTIEKTNLENTLSSLSKEIETGVAKKLEIETSLFNLVPVYERVTWQINQLTETVNTVVTTNNEGTRELNILIGKLKEVITNESINNQVTTLTETVQKGLEVNTESVRTLNKSVVELQKILNKEETYVLPIE